MPFGTPLGIDDVERDGRIKRFFRSVDDFVFIVHARVGVVLKIRNSKAGTAERDVAFGSIFKVD